MANETCATCTHYTARDDSFGTCSHIKSPIKYVPADYGCIHICNKDVYLVFAIDSINMTILNVVTKICPSYEACHTWAVNYFSSMYATPTLTFKSRGYDVVIHSAISLLRDGKHLNVMVDYKKNVSIR